MNKIKINTHMVVIQNDNEIIAKIAKITSLKR